MSESRQGDIILKYLCYIKFLTLKISHQNKKLLKHWNSMYQSVNGWEECTKEIKSVNKNFKRIR